MEYFNRKHFVFVFIPFTLPFTKTYSSVIVKLTGRDSWINILLSGLMLTAFALLFINIMKKNNMYDLHKIYTIALGKTLSKFFLFPLFITVCFTTVEASGTLSSVLHTNLLVETPIYFFLVFIFIIGGYMASKNTYTVITVTVIFVCIIIVAGIALSYLATPYKDFAMMKPILMNGITKTFYLSIIKCLGALSTFYLSLFYLPFIKNKNKLNVPLIIGLLFCIQATTYACLGQICTFQVDRLKSMWYPALLQTQLISQFKAAESGELFVMIQVVGAWTLRYMLSLHILCLLIKKTKLNFKKTFFILMMFLFIITNILQNNIFTWFNFINIFVYITFFQYLFLPIIIFILFNFRNNKSLSEN